MAWIVRAVRQRERGAEVSVVNDSNGREVVLWKHLHAAGSPIHQAWVTDGLQKVQAQKAAFDAERAQEEADLSAAGFKSWLQANVGRADVREMLRPLVRTYQTEIG